VVNTIGNIQFQSDKFQSKFLSPLKEFQEDIHEIEHRLDPLTNTRSIIGSSMRDKAQMIHGTTDYERINKIAQESKVNCFMCPEKVLSMTPKYTPDLLPHGRISKGEATLFPNLFPLSEFHAVCAFTHAHYLNLSDFTPELLANGIQICLEFIIQVAKTQESAKYMTINSNYLFPAGASVIHPHIQVMGGEIPYTFQSLLLTQSQRYFEENNSIYWHDLVTTEKELGARYIGRTGNIEWITSFSPMGSNEVQGILLNKHNFLELTQEDVKALGEGLSKILSFYGEQKYSTFNFSIYSGPLDDSAESFWCSIRIITRANVYENYRTDDYFLQKLLGTEILITPPEELAGQIQRKFNTAEQ